MTVTPRLYPKILSSNVSHVPRPLPLDCARLVLTVPAEWEERVTDTGRVYYVDHR